MEQIFRAPNEAGAPKPSIYDSLATPPQNALKPIAAGNLKGKSDINPQWRIEAMTRQFGPCGIGWKYEIVESNQLNLADGQILLFMRIDLYYKQEEKWSDPIPGFGGDFIVEKNKNGLVANDEAYKMCLTDALGNAMKCIGVAADVYRGLYESKYSRQHEYGQQQYPPQVAQPQAAATEPMTRMVSGKPQIKTKNGWMELTACSDEMLQKVLQTQMYAPVHAAANKLLTTGAL